MKLPKKIVENAQRLDAVRRMKHAFEKEEEELTGVLRPYVEKMGKENAKGQKAVWNELLEIFLEPNPKVEISPLGLFQLLKKGVWDFLAVRKTELEKARKEKTVNLSDEQVKKISQKSDGTPRVRVEIKVVKKHPRGLVINKGKKGE